MSYKKLTVVAIAVLMLAGLFLILRPDSPTPQADNNTNQTTPQTRTIKLDISAGKLTSGDGTIQVMKGERITLDASGDVADELHLHGYDKSIELEPGKRKSVTFIADKTGSFEAELHDSESPVFVLVVQPK